MGGQYGVLPGWDWLEHGFAADDIYNMDTDLLAATPWSAASSSSQTSSLSAVAGAGTKESNAITGSIVGQRLPALIAEMQQRLETLENGSWFQDNTRSFDCYPIGTVLRLSQEFGALAGQALGMDITYGGDSSDVRMTGTSSPFDGAAQSEGARGLPTSSGGQGDTATVRLVLGGYLSLIRLYGLVLRHFEAHLSRIPSGSLSFAAGQGPRTGNMANASPTLQLGELPSAGAMPEVSRIHAALGMLLAALHDVEEQLGRGGEIARDMVVALLTQGSGVEPVKLRDGLGGLGEKVRSVKDLLREKMGL